MAQPATPPFAPAPAPAPPPTPGQPAPPYPYYPPPPPKRTSTVLVVVLIVVVLIVVVVIVLAAVLFLFVGGLMNQGTTPPVLAFTPPSLSDGNATFEVGGASRSDPISSFTFRLEVGVVRSPSRVFAASGVPQTVTVVATTYQVTWNETSGFGLLSPGDTISVVGDGVPLGAGSYTFHLYWALTGAEITTRAWSI